MHQCRFNRHYHCWRNANPETHNSQPATLNPQPLTHATLLFPNLLNLLQEPRMHHHSARQLVANALPPLPHQENYQVRKIKTIDYRHLYPKANRAKGFQVIGLL